MGILICHPCQPRRVDSRDEGLNSSRVTRDGINRTQPSLVVGASLLLSGAGEGWDWTGGLIPFFYSRRVQKACNSINEGSRDEGGKLKKKIKNRGLGRQSRGGGGAGADASSSTSVRRVAAAPGWGGASFTPALKAPRFQSLKLQSI